MRILVVDDEIVSRKKMQKILENYGKCREVDNGKEALEMVASGYEKGLPYDLISLDVEMPEMRGEDVLFTIRELEEKLSIHKLDQTKVLMVTSKADKETVLSCIQGGCDDYVVKPFNRETIVKKLKTLGFKIE